MFFSGWCMQTKDDESEQNSGQSIVVIIPMLNEEHSIGHVLADIPEALHPTVIVADNGSTDRSRAVAQQAGAIVVSEAERGYGAACLAGIAEAARHQPDIVVFLDGDYSDHPDEMTAVIEPILQGRADLVIGSRARGDHDKGALLPQARFGNWLATRLISLVWNYEFTDLGPFRAVRWKSLMAMHMRDRNFGWTVEMQIKAAILGLRCTEVPVSYRKRIGVSKVTGTINGTVKAGFKILWTIGSYTLRKPKELRVSRKSSSTKD